MTAIGRFQPLAALRLSDCFRKKQSFAVTS
jgi:hypothetical protein